jgi:PAS domain S-box-containing protein
VTADPFDVLVVLVGSVVLLAGLPLIYTVRRTSLTLLLLYVHIATVLTFGGIMGAVFIVPLHDDVVLLGGQLAYGGFMFTALLTVIVGRDVLVLRNVIVLTVAVNLVKFVFLHLAHFALTTDGMVNPFDIAPEVVDQSIRIVLLGGLLNLAELILLLALLEWAKLRVPVWAMRPLYVAAYVGIVILDGVLFPVLVLSPSEGLGDAIAAGVQAKAVLALMFGIPLALFVLLNGKQLQGFEETPLRMSYLVTTPQSNLVNLVEQQEEQIARQQASLDLTSARMGEARATVDSLLDSATSMVLVAVDRGLQVTHFSAGAESILGYEASHVVGNEVQMLLDRAEVRRQAAAVGRPDIDLDSLLDVLATTRARNDWALRTISGEARTLSISVTPIGTDHGVVGYVLAGEDVTERLEATKALSASLEREQQALAQLRSADRLRNQLVSTVSHELSTPITSINGYLEMLLAGDGGLSSGQQDAIERVLRNTGRLRRLVEDLRLIAEVDTGWLSVDRVDLDLREVAESCRERVEASVSTRDLVLVWDMPERPVLVHGDPDTLREVVLRLVGNAVKFTPDGGRVAVAVESGADRGVLTVSDTGIGIPEEDQRRMFGRFERGTGAEERAIQGAGLGLSIVSTVVRRHGGQIEVDSAPGDGTTIRVVLPLAEQSR